MPTKLKRGMRKRNQKAFAQGWLNRQLNRAGQQFKRLPKEMRKEGGFT